MIYQSRPLVARPAPLVFLLLCSLSVPFATAAETPQRDFAWEQQALLAAEQASAEGPITITREASSDGVVEYDFEVKAPYTEARIRQAVSVPDVEITTVSVQAHVRAADGTIKVVNPQVDVEPLGWVRGFKIARVSLSTYPAGEAAITSGTVKVTFSIPPATSNPNPDWVSRETKGPLYDGLTRLVANPSGLKKYIVRDPTLVPTPVEDKVWDALAIKSPFRLHLPVKKTGLYRFSGADLQSSGVQIAQINPAHLRMFVDGDVQPLHHVPQAAGSTSIAPGDEFVFYGYENPSAYSATNMYWLMADATTPAVPFKTIPAPRSGDAPVRADLFIDTARVEKDVPPVLTQNDQFLTILDYRWVWWTWTEGRGAVPDPTPHAKPRQVSFELPGLYTTGADVTARAYLYNHVWPAGTGPFTLRVKINEATPVELLLESAHADQKEFKIPAAALRESNNVASLELVAGAPGTTTTESASKPSNVQICFDRLEIDYPRQYRLTDGELTFTSPPEEAKTLSTRQVLETTAPRTVQYQLAGIPPGAKPIVLDVTSTMPQLVVTGPTPGGGVNFRASETERRTYKAALLQHIPRVELQPVSSQGNLRSPDMAADYIIITHALFREQMEPFAEAKRAAGHAVQIVDINQLYDQFAAGQQVPHAIRRFLHYATQYWRGSEKAPAATYVLLVGDSTSAYRDEFKNQVINYVPSMTVSESVDRYASDLWFGTSMGKDVLADNYIGRFSINNVKDLQNILEKQRRYSAQGAAPWRNTLAYIADHSEFESATESVIERTVPSRFFLERLMLSEEPWIDNYYFPLEVAEAKKSKVSPVMTAKIRDMFNEGAAMVTYFGHGSPNVWSNERIWFGGDSENSDNQMLTNVDRLAFIVNMTCNSGAIDYPMPRWNICISEDFMRIPNGGAVACYVPSGPGVTNQHERFTFELNRALLQEEIKPLGPALALANWRYHLAGNPADLIRMFILLGDPGLELALAAPAGKDMATADAVGQARVPASLASEPPGWYQYVRHNPDFAASATDQWTTGGTQLPAPAGAPADGPVLVPVLSSRGQSLPLHIGQPPVLKIENYRIEDSQTGRQLKVTLRNLSRLPVSSFAFELRTSNGKGVAAIPVTEMGALEERVLRVDLPYPSTLQRVIAGYQVPGLPFVELQTDKPIVVVPENPGVAAAIDPASVRVSYSNINQVVQASITVTVYNLTSTSLTTAAVIFHAAGEGAVTSSSAASIAPMGSTLATVTVPVSSLGDTTGQVGLLVNGVEAGLVEEAVVIGPSHLGDISITGDETKVTPESPMDGETVFFDVVVRNLGKAAMSGVQVEGLENADTTSPRPMDRRIATARKVFTLEPGSSETVRVRWDPFRNSGVQHVKLRAISSSHQAELRTDNNEVHLTVNVRTKSRVRPVDIKILPLTPEDRAAKQIKVVATLRNDGESAAQGVRVVFYPTPKVTPNDVMGDVIIPVIPAGETREAVLAYKLKPGEETRPFLPSCEAMLKGSLQRTPYAPPQAGQ